MNDYFTCDLETLEAELAAYWARVAAVAAIVARLARVSVPA